MHLRRRTAILLAGFGAASLALTACGGSTGGADATTLTVYNAQHANLISSMVADFTKQTGVKVDLRNGDDFELANQIVAEGAATPADVFLTENSPAMALVDAKGGFARLDAATLAQVPKQFQAPDGAWVGFAARSTVLVYNTSKLTPARLPASIMDLAAPSWKGRFGIATAGADFQAIVSAVLALRGEAATSRWLAGLKANASGYRGNIAVMKAVDIGQVDAGIIYHYYWYRDQAESGASSSHTRLRYFGNKDPGAFVSVSGAGVLEASRHQQAARQLVRYLTGRTAQQTLARSGALEYPLGRGVAANPALRPFASLDPPEVDLSALNGPRVVELMQKAGLL